MQVREVGHAHQQYPVVLQHTGNLREGLQLIEKLDVREYIKQQHDIETSVVERQRPKIGFLHRFRLVRRVDEGYVGRSDLPHVWCYPWVLRHEVEAADYEILRFKAPSIPRALSRVGAARRPLDAVADGSSERGVPFFRSLGYGSIVVARKHPSESP